MTFGRRHQRAARVTRVTPEVVLAAVSSEELARHAELLGSERAPALRVVADLLAEAVSHLDETAREDFASRLRRG